MTLRITGKADLAAMPSRFQEQITGSVHDIRGLSPSRRPRYREEACGRQIVRWIDLLHVDHAPLGRVAVAEYFSHTPNGGARNGKEAAILQGQGVRAGWPDYTLLLPRGPFHGAVAELKHENGDKPDNEQLEILLRLERAGYKAMVWFGFADAQKQLMGYLQLGPAAAFR